MGETSHEPLMKLALKLAQRALGRTSPNPMVGAVLVRDGRIIGKGYHHAAGRPHAEIEALQEAEARGESPQGATLYVTLEPCCTHGRTPPCTDAILRAGIRHVVVGAADPNPRHAGRGLKILADAGVRVESGVLEPACTQLNQAFNHWVVHRTPLATIKAAMTLDGKIATATGESKWITGARARLFAMRLRLQSDAILVGINTLLADDPSLTVRDGSGMLRKPIRRLVLDTKARTPLTAKVVSDDLAHLTTIIVTPEAPGERVRALQQRVSVWEIPSANGRPDLKLLVKRLGEENVLHLLVEGGGEVNFSFLEQQLAHRVAFFYAPLILGGADSRKGVAGEGFPATDVLRLSNPHWRKLGPDLLLTADVDYGP